jgi:hypothetical protein
VLDGIAVAVDGTKEQAIRILAAHEQALSGTPEASAIGWRGRSMRWTAMAWWNCCASPVVCRGIGR